jgi:hypothetical protein
MPVPVSKGKEIERIVVPIAKSYQLSWTIEDKFRLLFVNLYFILKYVSSYQCYRGISLFSPW